MTRNSMLLVGVAVAVFGLACGPQYASKPMAADSPEVANERGRERDISLEDVPRPVREAMVAAAGEHRITEIEEVKFTDRTEYEAEWKVDGEEVEVRFAADGSIIGRTAGDDDGDDR